MKWFEVLILGVVVLLILFFIGKLFDVSKEAQDECTAKGGVYAARDGLCLRPEAVIR